MEPVIIPFIKIPSPLGMLIAAASDEGICLLQFPGTKKDREGQQRVANALGGLYKEQSHPHLEKLKDELDRYFAGQLITFTVPLHFTGTPFQNRVWNALCEIPYGITRSYQQQAILLGDEKAIRAVAKANGDNPIAIVVPCHRIIGKDGSMTGYAGGLENKKWLLAHEGKQAGKSQQQTLFN